MPDIQGQLVLAQNQFAFIQDATKGTVQVYSGPFSLALSANDRPVVYDRKRDAFVAAGLSDAITQFLLVPEGHYLILENPVTDKDNKLSFPKSGANSPVTLEVGRKINVSGPVTFPLWPGQVAQTISGHHLRSNQYLVARVYNTDEALKNRPDFLEASETMMFDPGQLLVIKGTEVSFFIPPTGFEVLTDVDASYVREALTLERLEYCILLDEEGAKRYEKGPAVVFPSATERFVTKDNAKKFKALELNDQMGLYIKVIADYIEDDTAKTQRKTGDELFITGKEQRIYYPRPEHALIEYDDPNQKSFKRQRYYGITIPKGEGRYVLDKEKGDIQMQTGPKIFLPDPRNQVIVRRVLDTKTVTLWYPSNQEALNFNESLRALSEESLGYLSNDVVGAASADITRGMNRGLTQSKGLPGSFEGDTLKRGSKFTPPPMLTLNTKYDGVPAINVWNGYAVQVVNKAGQRTVHVGPDTILLQYDESLGILELSTGKPKNTDKILRDVYLRVDNNLVSDIVRIETKDLVNVDLRLSYRVNFSRDHKDVWFSVENYVKFLCDHIRSLLKGRLKKQGVKELMEDSAALIRDTVLGTKKEGEPRKKFFPENGMEVYDVEVLGVAIADENIARLLKDAQMGAVQSAITLSADEANLESTRRKTAIRTEIDELETSLLVRKQELERQVAEAKAKTVLAALNMEIQAAIVRREDSIAEIETTNAVAEAELNRDKATSDHDLSILAKQTEFFELRMKAITPNLIEAMMTLGNTEFATKLTTAIAPLALHQQQGLDETLKQVFHGTPLATILDNVNRKAVGK